MRPHAMSNYLTTLQMSDLVPQSLRPLMLRRAGVAISGGETMPQVPAFHSSKEKHHHNNSKCGPGSEIPLHNRAPGTGFKPLCADCAKLNAAGK